MFIDSQAPEIVGGYLVVDFKVLLVRLKLGSSLRENGYFLHPTHSLGVPPTLSTLIKQFSGAVAGDFGAVARGVSYSQSLYFAFFSMPLLFFCLA